MKLSIYVKTVTEASKAQLENGVITSSDYLREVNAEDQSRQARILHHVQLIEQKYILKQSPTIIL